MPRRSSRNEIKLRLKITLPDRCKSSNDGLKIVSHTLKLFSELLTSVELNYLHTIQQNGIVTNKDYALVQSIANKYLKSYQKLGGQCELSKKRKKFSPKELRKKILQAETAEQKNNPYYILNQNRWGNYKRFLQSGVWRRIRANKLKLVFSRCEWCQNKRADQVHHIEYGIWGNEFPEQLLAVCNDCHEIIHGIKKENHRKQSI